MVAVCEVIEHACQSPVLCQKAKQLAKESGFPEFKATDGWFTRWKKQHDITFISLKEEAAKAVVKAAKMFVTEPVSKLLKTFPEENIRNTDEIGIYFCALPDSMYVCKNKKKDKRGFKVAKDHATSLVCCSMAGEKQPLLFIGKSKTPCCLKHVNLPMTYNFLENWSITRQVWKKWLEDLDQQLSCQNRSILLLFSNKVHIKVDGMTKVTMKFLLANTTFVLQLCDQEIIRALKAHF